MYSVTTAVKNALLGGNTITAEISVTPKSGSAFTLTESRIVMESFSIDRTAANYGEVMFGSAATNELRFTIRNADGAYNSVNFGDARMDVSFYTVINGTKTRVCDGGRFYVMTAPLMRETIEVTAYGCLSKTENVSDRAGDSGYNSSLLHIAKHEWSRAFGTENGLDYTNVSDIISATLMSGFAYPSGNDMTGHKILAWVAALCGAILREHGNSDSAQFVRRETTGIQIGSAINYGGEYQNAVTISGVKFKADGDWYTSGQTTYPLEFIGNGIFEGAGTYRQTLVNAVGQKLNSFSYIPCSFRIRNLCFLEPGDQIQFWSKQEGAWKTTVLSRVHITLRGVTIEASGQSAEMKTLSAAVPSTIGRGSITEEMISTDALKSRNYSYTSGVFSNAGTYFNLRYGTICSKNFAIDELGNAYFAGNLAATSGYFGRFFIDNERIMYRDLDGESAIAFGAVKEPGVDDFYRPYILLFGNNNRQMEIDFDGIFMRDPVAGAGGSIFMSNGKFVLSDDVYLGDNLTSKLKDRLGGGGGTTDFNNLSNRPKYNGITMSGSTNIPEVKTSAWDAKFGSANFSTNDFTISNGVVYIKSKGYFTETDFNPNDFNIDSGESYLVNLKNVVRTTGGTLTGNLYVPTLYVKDSASEWKSVYNLFTALDTAKLPKAGGTITGNLTVNGTLSAGTFSMTNIEASSQVKAPTFLLQDSGGEWKDVYSNLILPLQDNKLNKSGGTITGNLTVNGTLSAGTFSPSSIHTSGSITSDTSGYFATLFVEDSGGEYKDVYQDWFLPLANKILYQHTIRVKASTSAEDSYILVQHYGTSGTQVLSIAALKALFTSNNAYYPACGYYGSHPVYGVYRNSSGTVYLLMHYGEDEHQINIENGEFTVSSDTVRRIY